MDEIYLIIRKIGDLEDIADKAYWYYEQAEHKASELQEKSHNDGYTDFKYSVKTIELVGLK